MQTKIAEVERMGLKVTCILINPHDYHTVMRESRRTRDWKRLYDMFCDLPSTDHSYRIRLWGGVEKGKFMVVVE